MKPLIVLLIVFAVSAFATKLLAHRYDFSLSARIAMCTMLLFTAIGHFAFTKGMAMMMPEFIPFKIELVYLTGLLEIILGIALLFPSTKVYSGWILIVFFVIVLPANIKAATEQIDFQNADFGGPGLNYLWFRIPLQIFLIAWTYISSIRF